MAYIKGKDVLIFMSGQRIGAAKSCDIVVNTDEIETASADNGQWRTYIKGRSDWEMTVSVLVTDVVSVLNSGVEATMTCQIAGKPGKTYLTGNVICTSARIIGTVGNLTTGAYKFRGNGELYGD